MLRVPLFVEMVRSRPHLVFWAAALTQGALWWLVPSLFYAAPPGNAAEVVAIGHEFELGNYLGPPLAFWLADIAFTIFGRSMIGVYLLAQACVVVAYWAVFALGRAIVGTHHAVIAVLLMVGVTAFTVSSPNFGPSVLAMPLVALAMLHFWRAVGEEKSRYWFAVALDVGLLILTTYAGLIVLALIVLFTLANERSRAMLTTLDPWMGGIVVTIVLFPHLIWLDASGYAFIPSVERLLAAPDSGAAVFASGHLLGQILFVHVLFVHVGLIVLVALGGGWRANEQPDSSTFVRRPTDPFARRFVYWFALLPAGIATLLAVVLGGDEPAGGVAPLVLLTGVAIVLAAGDVIVLQRERLAAIAWGGLLVLPPVTAILAILLFPWVAGSGLRVDQPAGDIGRFFTESFERRTGKRLAVVTGDPRLAELVAIASPSRPSLWFYASPERSPWIGADDIARKGAVIVWPTSDTVGTPPADIKARFPQIVPEVPRAFERPVQGRLPLMRIGWAVVRPREEGAPPGR